MLESTPGVPGWLSNNRLQR